MDINGAKNNDVSISKTNQTIFYKTNPYKSPKFLAKLVGLALLGPLGWVPIENGTTTLAQSELGHLILLILLLTSLIKIAIKNPTGWVYFATFFYYGAFAHKGVVAWLYMLLTGLALYVHSRWSKES